MRPYNVNLEVVPYPHFELRPPELLAAADRRIQRVFPLAVERRPPRPVEVDGEAQREGLQAEAVRRVAVAEAEARDVDRGAEDRNGRACGRIHVGPQVRRVRLRLAGRKLVRLVVEVRRAGPEE